MRPELQSVGNFLTYLIETSPTRMVKITKLKNFTINLVEVLQKEYRYNWFLHDPYKGSNRRAIKFHPRATDCSINRAACMAGIKEWKIYSSMPPNICIWIDPLEVTYRIGENGHIRLLYEHGILLANRPWEARDGHGKIA